MLHMCFKWMGIAHWPVFYHSHFVRDCIVYPITIIVNIKNSQQCIFLINLNDILPKYWTVPCCTLALSPEHFYFSLSIIYLLVNFSYFWFRNHWAIINSPKLATTQPPVKKKIRFLRTKNHWNKKVKTWMKLSLYIERINFV